MLTMSAKQSKPADGPNPEELEARHETATPDTDQAGAQTTDPAMARLTPHQIEELKTKAAKA